MINLVQKGIAMHKANRQRKANEWLDLANSGIQSAEASIQGLREDIGRLDAEKPQLPPSVVKGNDSIAASYERMIQLAETEIGHYRKIVGLMTPYV